MTPPLDNASSMSASGAEHAQLPLATRIRRGLRFGCFLTAIFMALTYGGWFWMARIGWMVLAVICTTHWHYGLYLTGFFAAFFHSAGFMPQMFFTLKHYHIALALLLIVHLLRNQPRIPSLRQLILTLKQLWPIGVLILWSIITAQIAQAPAQAYLFSLNLTSLLAGVIYLSGVVLTNIDDLKRMLVFFLLGVSTQVALGSWNLFMNSHWLDLQIIHNNHVGMMTAPAVFFALALTISARTKGKQLIGWIMTGIIAAGLVLSCSRTSWFSFLAGAVLFTVVLHHYAPDYLRKIYSRCIFFGIIFVATVVFFTTSFESVGERMAHLYQIFMPNEWEYTLHDTQNFGFLGIYRLEQFYDIAEILRQRPLTGIGFAPRVTDYHGFYLAALGATGIPGLLLVLFFIRTIVCDLLNYMKQSRNLENLVFGAATLSALAVWFLVSLMETFIVQFSAWFLIIMATTLLAQSRQKISK